MNDEGGNQRITTKLSNSKNSVPIAKQGKTERAIVDRSVGCLAFSYVNLEVKDTPRQEMHFRIISKQKILMQVRETPEAIMG